MELKNFKLGKEYSFLEIDNSIKDEYDNIEYGNSSIGENFWVIKRGENAVSFILSGVSATSYMYKCIYSDYQNPCV